MHSSSENMGVKTRLLELERSCCIINWQEKTGFSQYGAHTLR